MNEVPSHTMKTLQMAARINVDNEKKESFGQFFGFIARFKKNYDNQTELYSRYQRFASAISRVEQLNQEHKGNAQFELNQFADLTPEEFLERHAGSRMPEKASEARTYINFGTETRARSTTAGGNDFDSTNRTRSKRSYLPYSYDMRDENLITGVRDQGQCGCCFIFASLEGIQGAYAKKYRTRVRLSVEQILSCYQDAVPHSQCNGGNTEDVLQFVAKYGVARDSDYPFTSSDGYAGTCQNENRENYSTGFSHVRGEEEDMKEALYNYGTLVVGMDAEDLQYYSRGIFSPSGRSNQINHSVNIVGWGEENGTPYWIVKNSWTNRWGENGYFRITRGYNTALIESYVQVALV
ncbi:unnamed protein product [Bursaphelenchus okinawaensis]|uniref:Uncharacterized protein n=1 Tax=Bursaphelenchus okinawaensis TaxID=465554 RepID=A0A811KCJ3_9BILA|nr:unnamed protein product [Bursaphelenchus okinawaensis]CAG9100958.1 unnamed protein product [Bursaphelenchus okinawaensis]